MKKLVWGVWGILTLVLMMYFLYKIFSSEDKSDFLIGQATHGHHQIEMACETCHTDPFGGEEVLQNACENCHAEELKDAHDSHPKKKFTDPRNADRLEVVDARYCISCHTEHQKEQTLAMGLTLPKDYCFHCHAEVIEERESHKGLAFDSCASAGCHNYHDNRALYEDFLVEHAGKTWLHDISRLSQANAAGLVDVSKVSNNANEFEDKKQQHPDIHTEWLASSHANAGVNCGACHTDTSQPDSKQWLDKPGIEQCETCHSEEAKGFVEGKHGMRLSDKLSQSLSPMTPAMSELTFHENMAHQELTCNSCHGAHTFDTSTAATESCLSCHADEHSLAFKQSPHGQLWTKELAGDVAEGEGVSCATCHMYRKTEVKAGKEIVSVEHNQNATLRPNEKMIRPVCMQCHSLEFSIDALADEELIRNNFQGKPGAHIQSIDWALKRAQ